MSKLNVQNFPKNLNFLKSFTVPKGYKLLYSDINTLEPHVMAHFTQDPGLLSLYGPEAKPNCVYLFTGAQISKWKDEFLQYYDPFNPTEESVALAKKKCKASRSAIKPVYLGWLYGLGARTMSESTGIEYEECKQILSDINDAYLGVRRFNSELRAEWERNGGSVVTEWQYSPELEKDVPVTVSGDPGWILNGRMRPIAVAPDKVKDLGSRFVQSTGHDCLMQLLCIINRRRKLDRIPMRPYNVDIHDATVWQIREECVEEGKRLIEDSYVELNEILGWTVQIKGDVEIGDNLGDFLE